MYVFIAKDIYITYLLCLIISQLNDHEKVRLNALKVYRVRFLDLDLETKYWY